LYLSPISYIRLFIALLCWLGISRYTGGRSLLTSLSLTPVFTFMSAKLNKAAQIIRSMNDKAVSMVD
jgi:hypothetical protein